MMFFLQVYLISKGLNTAEYFRGGFKKNNNPFDEGTLKNCWNFLKRKRWQTNINKNYLIAREGNHNENNLEMHLQTFT